jgi:hypothetical protein
VKTIIAFACSFLFLLQARAADLTVPDIKEVNPHGTTNCLNDGAAVISVGSTDGTYLYGTASYERFVCRLRVHSGRGPGIALLSGCADVIWSASTGELVSLTYQGSVCPQ